MKNNKKIDNIIAKATNQEDFILVGGERVVALSYLRTIRQLNSSHIVIDEIVWRRDLQSFLESLRKFDIDKIIITNTSTALMGLLHFLIENGCAVEGTAKVEDKEGYMYSEEIQALLVKIN